jgi:hypothetical protein
MAYLIAGHGEEIPYNNTNQKKTFTVPRGCTIVVHKHPYELSNENNFNIITDKLLLLSKDIINNPVQYKYEIINKLGSVVFYEEGEQCPYFYYQTSARLERGHNPKVCLCHYPMLLYALYLLLFLPLHERLLSSNVYFIFINSYA